ncbi:hypothetical protein CH380_13855 [Leptospira adleri]|uniref:Uncharacterized protein n=1 Tax=Leptospira adleri TaxID=2023186 RepID=A0A2M9YLV8_9LEPT|nr:hypothetical protein CH380_13855 [Leptospira adleri]PJZ60852.1 hypothetical protein CH376_16160 [Leptospira adleri]
MRNVSDVLSYDRTWRQKKIKRFSRRLTVSQKPFGSNKKTVLITTNFRKQKPHPQRKDLFKIGAKSLQTGTKFEVLNAAGIFFQNAALGKNWGKIPRGSL